MDPSDPALGMAEYQLLGSDGFGYHSGYGVSSAPGAAGQPTPGPPGPSPTIGSSQVPTAGSLMGMGMGPSGYHPGVPRYGPPDPKTSGLHSQYPYGAPPGLPGPQPMMSSRSQYGPSDPRGGYPGLPDYSSSHLGMSAPGHQSLSSPYASRLMSSQFGSSDQRMPTSSMPRAPAPIHPMSGYPGYPSAGYGATDVWGSSAQSSHIQRPPYSYPGGSTRNQSSFPQPSGDQYMGSGPLHGISSSRPYYAPPPPPVGSSSAAPSASTSHIPPPEASQSSYPPSAQGPFGSSRNQSSGSQNQRQTQYSSQFSSGPGSAVHQPPSAPGPASSSGASVSSRYSQQYPLGYGPQGPSAFSDGGSQSRLSPFGMQPAGIGPNSPGYRPPYSGNSSSSTLPQMSPRRPTPTPPIGSPMPPASRTPDRVSTAGTASVSSQPPPGSYSSSSGSASIGPSTGASSSGPPPSVSNSLAQLEQMVGGGSSASGPKQQSASSAPYYGPPGTPQNAYPPFSTPTSGHSVPPSQSSYYYQQQPSPAGPWSGVQPSPQSTSSSVPSNTHSGPTSSSNIPYSPSGISNVSHRSPQQPSGMGSSKGPLPPSQFGSRFENQYNSPADNSSFHSKSNESSSHLPSMSSLQKPSGSGYDVGPGFADGNQSKSESQQDQNLPKPDERPKNSSDAYQSSSSFFSALRASTENSTSSMSPEQNLVTLQKPDTQGRNQSGAPSQDQSYLSRPQASYGNMPQSDSQSSYMSQMYPQSSQQSQQPDFSHSSQQLSQFSYNSDSYDMSGMSDLNSYGAPTHDQRMYEQGSYPPHNMDNMMGGNSGMSNYQGEMGGQAGFGSEPSPYDEPFSSEPPTKRKGKGRPKKDPLVPKEPKKPRQPRAPKSPRGRGRGARSNMGDRSIGTPGSSSDAFGDGLYGMPPDPSDMYQLPPQGPPPGHNQMAPHHPPPHDPYLPHHGSHMSPHHMPPPPQPVMEPLSIPPNIPVHPDMNSFEGLRQNAPPAPVTVGVSSEPALPVTTSTVDTERIPAPSLQLDQSGIIESQVPQNSTDSSSQDSQSLQNGCDVLPAAKHDFVPPDDNTSQVTRPAEDSVDQMPCDDMFSQSTSSSTETPLFTIPSEDSSGLIPTPAQPESTESSVLPQAPVTNQVTAEMNCGPEFTTQSCETKNEAVPPQPSSFEFSEDKMVVDPETPVKRKGKKRKSAKSEKQAAAEEQSTPSAVLESGVVEETPVQDAATSGKKAKKPKKERVKKPKKETPKVDTGLELDQSPNELEGLADQSTADNTTLDSSGVFDDATQDDNNSQQDSSLNESPTKSGKKVAKGGIKTPKVKKPKLKEGKSTKKKLPKIALAKFKAKKKKRLGSSEHNSDIEKTPPPSPDEAESGIQKRRSARVTKRTKYLDEVDIDLSGDESKMKDENQDPVAIATISVDDTMVVEKIMLSRSGTRELEPENEEEEARFAGKPPTVEVEEFYVKYKNLSYLHCDWRTEEELERGDKRIGQKLKRFKMKKDSNSTTFDFLDDEPFNPDYCEVDRILDVNIVQEVIRELPKEVEKPVKSEGTAPVKEETPVANKAETEEMDVDQAKEDAKDIQVTTETDKPSKPDENQQPEEDGKDPIEDSTTLTKADPEKTDESEEKIEPKVEDNSCQTETPIPETIEEEKKVVRTRTVRHYLVKWQQLSYEECTWELEDDLDPIKVQNFWRFRELPSKERMKPKKRPKPQDWKKLDASPVYKSGNTLREYQLEGLNWLTFCWYNGRNCILADEMGLGKTIQSLAVINEMVKYGIHSPYLVIAPLSTIGNWQREFETWTDLNVITYHGSAASRNMLQEYEMFYKNEKGQKIEGVFKFQVMITTFEVVLTDCLELREIDWKCCVIDEAHRLKNRNCKLLEGLRLLKMEHRVLLTGTPLQNNVEELFSLLNFLEPQQFASPDVFMLEFGDLKTEEQVDKLKAILKPMMLRRLKEDVEKSLAPKEETIVEVRTTKFLSLKTCCVKVIA